MQLSVGMRSIISQRPASVSTAVFTPSACDSGAHASPMLESIAEIATQLHIQGLYMVDLSLPALRHVTWRSFCDGHAAVPSSVAPRSLASAGLVVVSHVY